MRKLTVAFRNFANAPKNRSARTETLHCMIRETILKSFKLLALRQFNSGPIISYYMRKACRRTNKYVYIIIHNFSAIVRIYTVSEIISSSMVPIISQMNPFYPIALKVSFPPPFFFLSYVHFRSRGTKLIYVECLQ